ncbi:CPBP family intramembrane glutamic endopeptidase [Clostridium tepidum]|jgi:membrane protease YdiL (CAAX protease family)|uniref:Protease n=1 Tax=Clostridium tepidum TaxID=1962263 RepID=A0A1S9I3Y8_9CLOT|nr:type II CAAX endopeptidase family protein [Clostridium tepidum]MCR1933333.1 CPBP family intramembrane metalloprotease [Clostridium tepidum]MDU6877494.1 type II CAAX endopeptidase family protein [Clostridium botulinum]OOO62616.1 protease [Clostridium tepidum]OOO65054.1 protease [Clostridium tepidum]
MVDNVEFKNKNSEEFIKILNIIVNLLLYQATFYMIFAILANILVYIGINKEFAKPYSKLVGEVLSYIFFIKNYKKNNKYKLKLKNTLRFKGYIFIAMLFIGYILVYDNTIKIIVLKIVKNSIFYDIMAREMKNPIVGFITTVIIAPIFEEIIYRGIILDELLDNYNYKKAIIISALVFAIVHFNFIQLPDAFIAGIILAAVYCETKSLIPCIAIHFFNNLFCNIAKFCPSICKCKFNIIKLSIGLVILITLAYIFNNHINKNDFISHNS